ncbi:hypothetical protein RHGRI_010819 [Rhododendron griersonianum]|uniref:RNase H type-1 domain-containing protein n=1 Tax=Rhododendron griersonianum TaxID=479676 RepID=A0AAV6KJN7_9ERIC|nr:hypothetical protein RHGRI_010819 [Rhododendron griersonianum]
MQQNQSLLMETVLALQKKSTTPPPPQAEREGTHPTGSQTETRDNQTGEGAQNLQSKETPTPPPEISSQKIPSMGVGSAAVVQNTPAFKLHLVTHHFPDFSTLYEAARNLNETVEPPLPPPRYQHSSRGRHPGPRQTAYAASGPPPTRSRGYPAKCPKYNEPPPLPVTAAEAQAFLDAWVQDGKATLPEARKEPTRRDMEHPDYCIYHRMVRHPTKDCWGLRTLFEKFMVEEAVELTATKDVLRNPLPNHKDNGKAVMMISKEGSPSTSNPKEKKRARDTILAKARAPAEDNVGPKVVRYTRPDERHCLALVFAAQKLRHYLLSYPLHLITKCDPIRYLLNRPALAGRPARWLLSLAEYEIICKALRAVKSQALADLLAHFPSGRYEPPSEDLPGDDFQAAQAEVGEWSLSFDGSSTAKGGGAGVVLTAPSGGKIPLSYKLDFHCSNNEAEYEALILGLMAALNCGITLLCVKGDSKLVVRQTNGEYAIRKPPLASYRTIVQRLTSKFDALCLEHAPRSENRHPDALATLASKVEVSGVPTKIEILKRSVPCFVAEIFPEEEIEDWRTSISNELKSASAAITLSNLKHFTIYQGVLYYRGSGGLLARCIGEEEAKVKVQEVHERSCGTGDASLYRRLQRQGYYWPTMVTDAAELQSKCSKCREIPSKAECNFIGVYSDWRKPYIDFLTDGTLPSDRVDMALVKK